MITQLSEETIAEYASDAQTIQAPQGTDFSQGVRVGRTVPAKWWNWLFNAVTKRVSQGRNDAQNMLTEMQQVVISAGATPNPNVNNQMAQAINTKAYSQVDKYVADAKKRFGTLWYNHAFTFSVPVQNNAVSGIELLGDAYIYGSATLTSGVSAPFYSVDGYFWKQTDRINFYANGMFFETSWEVDSSPNGWMRITIKARHNIDDINTTIFTIDNRYEGFQQYKYEPTIFAAGNDIILQTPKGDLYRYDAQSNTFLGTGYGQLDDQRRVSITYSSGSFKVIPEEQIIPYDGGYLIGGIKYKDGVFTKLGNGLGFGNVIPRALRNGNIAFISTTRYASISTNTMLYTSFNAAGLMDTEGNVTTQDISYFPLEMQPTLTDCVVRFDGVSHVEFSYDGINFTSLPFVFHFEQLITTNPPYFVPVCQVGSYYFVTPTPVFPAYSSIYRINNSLSSLDTDYTTLSVSLAKDAAILGSVQPVIDVGFGFCSVLESSSQSQYHYNISKDNGDTLVQAQLADSNGVVNVNITKKMHQFNGKYGIPTFNYWTDYATNIVSGHTLYLR